ncbi:MAG: transcription termination/antitermination NusG family protein [Sellimonas intestinalis]|uniref:transcription termination/antitermination NusG family protein n=1 Tax=Sellimonas intestinalis TaxID=1653434 RepID=UPI003995DFC2
MENWYAMKTMPEKEEEAAELIRRTIPPSLWESCTILRKKKLFRADGKLILSMEKMFPGYLFLQTDRIQDVSEMLKRSREYPHLLGEGGGQAVRMEEKDLAFLKQVCGEQAGSADGTFPGRGRRRRESDPGGGNPASLLPKDCKETTEEAVCAGRGGTLWKTGNRFIWDLSTRRSDLGREKINTAETLSTTVKTAGGRLR